MTTYMIDYQTKKDLLELISKLDADDRYWHAVDRLANFGGSSADVEIAAELYEMASEEDNAASLRRGCYGRDDKPEPDPGKDTRHRISLTVSRDQHQSIAEKANKRGLSIATYVRMVALEAE